MTILMSVTPLHMTQEGFQPGDISLVMAAHMLGMFGLAPLTGRLVDRTGPYWVIGLGALTLVITCGLAFVADSLEGLVAALFTLGARLEPDFCGRLGSLNEYGHPGRAGS